jgi:hypothetical protein
VIRLSEQNKQGMKRTCSEINKSGAISGERSVGKSWVLWADSLRCDEMRKRDVDETTQRWLDVVGEVVAVGARRKEEEESK